MRIGHGYDIHAFHRTQMGTGCIKLGGIDVPYAYDLIAHSDGDVVIHALCDAMLGACALGDIGMHFPDTDAQHQNQDSLYFLAQVRAKYQSLNYTIINIDVSILAQVPKLSPYILNMRQCLAVACGIELDQINIKATTHEGLGALGRAEGIAAHAVVLMGKNEHDIKNITE